MKTHKNTEAAETVQITKNPAVAQERLVRHLWRCGYVKPSAKPVTVIELGDGQIKVVGSCRIRQPLDQPNESYHESYEDALRRFVENGERDLKLAEAELAGAKRRLASRKAVWTNLRRTS